MVQSENNNIEDHIRESIAGYRELLTVYAGIREAVASGAPAERLQAQILHVQQLDERVREADGRFQALMAETGEFGQSAEFVWDLPIYAEWRELVARTGEESMQLGNYLKSAMTVIKDDISRLRQGRQVASGYRSRQDVSGRRINISSV